MNRINLIFHEKIKFGWLITSIMFYPNKPCYDSEGNEFIADVYYFEFKDNIFRRKNGHYINYLRCKEGYTPLHKGNEFIGHEFLPHLPNALVRIWRWLFAGPGYRYYVVG